MPSKGKPDNNPGVRRSHKKAAPRNRSTGDVMLMPSERLGFNPVVARATPYEEVEVTRTGRRGRLLFDDGATVRFKPYTTGEEETVLRTEVVINERRP